MFCSPLRPISKLHQWVSWVSAISIIRFVRPHYGMPSVTRDTAAGG
jgi:hypothetical protein